MSGNFQHPPGAEARSFIASLMFVTSHADGGLLEAEPAREGPPQLTQAGPGLADRSESCREAGYAERTLAGGGM